MQEHYAKQQSPLFPVALISAERRGDLSEDVYRLKPANSPDISVELVVTRLGMADDSQVRGVPVILLHGSFSNRRFWYSPKGVGLGAFLARAGFDVWLPEMRGHGLSRNIAWGKPRGGLRSLRFACHRGICARVERSGSALDWFPGRHQFGRGSGGNT